MYTPKTKSSVYRRRWYKSIHRVKWRHVTEICGHNAISMLWGNTACCVKLSGEDWSRYLNKIESVGLRKCLHYHCLTKNVMSQKETFIRACPTSWRENMVWSITSLPPYVFCSVLFLSRPRSEGWPHHGRTFSIYLYPLSYVYSAHTPVVGVYKHTIKSQNSLHVKNYSELVCLQRSRGIFIVKWLDEAGVEASACDREFSLRQSSVDWNPLNLSATARCLQTGLYTHACKLQFSRQTDQHG